MIKVTKFHVVVVTKVKIMSLATVLGELVK